MLSLLKYVLEAHGGEQQWEGVTRLKVSFNLSGALLDLKGYPGHRQPTIVIDPVSPYAELHGLDGADSDRWIFTPDRVWIERGEEILEERKAPRSSFHGHVRTTPWDRLQLLYFFGYAMWNYLTSPFLFAAPDFSARELEPHKEGNECWRVLEITFPDHIPTHTKVQKIYVDDAGMLRRLDYSTDVLGGVASHYCYDAKAYDGIRIPTLRRVVQRDQNGPKLSGPTSFVLDYVNVEVMRG